ncbi:hypothetical protein FGO68_gene17267 [Halteria grandinella]|uniref:SWIM-type domain-containing protein n=1 Tax=Halteria grandinella TaxID=5974 RepID=A0A8J8P7C5_HALGN|nr:hypothetical protein FGO68_gene17267 [Halteria grandinella]
MQGIKLTNNGIGILKVVKKVQHNHLANKSSTPQDSRVLYCPYSVQKDISTRFDFLKKSEQNLYSVLVSLPFLDDFEQFEKSLREVQQIPWGSPNLENLKVYLKDLEKDKYLWAIAYRSILVKDYAINKKLISQGLHIGSIFTGDLSACQRNVSVDCAMSNNFLLNSMGDFSPKECFKALQRLEENDVSFTNESKIVAAATLPALEANDVYKHFIASSHTVYIQQRFKYQMQKGMHYIVLESNSDQLDQIPKAKQWIVRNKEGSLKFNVTTHQITQQILGASKETTTIIQCDCGFSSISGIPCSHEFCVQHYLWHNALKNFQTPPHVLKIKQRWLQAYEDYYKGKLHEPPGGLMYEHKQLNFNLKHAQNAQQTKSAGKVAVCKNQRKRNQKQVEGLTPTKTKVTNAQHNEEVFDVPEDDAFSEDCELLISNAQSESDLQIQLNQHSSNSSVQKQKPRSSNKISIKMPTFSLNEFSASHKLSPLKIMNKKEKKPKVDKTEKKLIGKRRSGKRKREEKDSENEYANSAEEREKDIKEGLKDVAYKKRVIAGTAPSKVEVIEAIQSETESKKSLRRSRRQAKHDNKIKIKIDQQKLSQTLSTQPSNPTSIGPSQAKVINPKHRFNPKQSQNSILSQCSGSSQIPSIMTGSSQFTYSFSQAGQRDDADSILNLDDILKESEDPEKPPSSLEKWAGPNIFRDIVIQKPKYHSGVKIGLGQSQDDNPSQRTLIFINTQNTQVQPCSQQA